MRSSLFLSTLIALASASPSERGALDKRYEEIDLVGYVSACEMCAGGGNLLPNCKSAYYMHWSLEGDQYGGCEDKQGTWSDTCTAYENDGRVETPLGNARWEPAGCDELGEAGRLQGQLIGLDINHTYDCQNIVPRISHHHFCGFDNGCSAMMVCRSTGPIQVQPVCTGIACQVLDGVGSA